MTGLYALLLVSATLSLIVAIIAWRQRPAPGALGLGVLAGLTGVWSLSNFFQWVLLGGAPSYVFLVLRNVTILGAPVAILVLVLEYTGDRSAGSPRHLAWPLGAALALLIGIATDPWHHLYLGDYPPTMLQYQGGPLYPIKFLFVSLMTCVALALLTQAALRGTRVQRRQIGALVAAIAIPSLVILAESAGVHILSQMSIAPLVFTFSDLLVAYALFRLGLLELVPVARDLVMETMPDGFLVVDGEHRIVDLNPAARDLLQLDPSDLGRRTDGAMPWALSVIVSLREQVAVDGDAHARVTTPEGRTLDVLANRIAQEGRPPATVVSIRDATRSEELERMQRDFVAHFSHELQTPLAGLSLLAETLPTVVRTDPDRASAYALRMSSEVSRLVRMAKQLLALSRSERRGAGEYREARRADLGGLVQQVVETLEPLAEQAGVRLSVSAPEGVIVEGDPAALTGMAQSLIENAVTYTPAGGSVKVAVGLLKREGEPRQAVLRVQDDGMGIDPADLERVFERFYRGENARASAHQGSGLGLSIARSVVQGHRGSIAVESAPGSGARFTVKLPLADGEAGG